MSLTAKITLCKEMFIAELSDGRLVEQPDTRAMAQALCQCGVNVSGLHFDWRSGTRMITAGTKIALVAGVRQLESSRRSQYDAA